MTCGTAPTTGGRGRGDDDPRRATTPATAPREPAAPATGGASWVLLSWALSIAVIIVLLWPGALTAISDRPVPIVDGLGSFDPRPAGSARWHSCPRQCSPARPSSSAAPGTRTGRSPSAGSSTRSSPLSRSCSCLRCCSPIRRGCSRSPRGCSGWRPNCCAAVRAPSAACSRRAPGWSCSPTSSRSPVGRRPAGSGWRCSGSPRQLLRSVPTTGWREPPRRARAPSACCSASAGTSGW